MQLFIQIGQCLLKLSCKQDLFSKSALLFLQITMQVLNKIIPHLNSFKNLCFVKNTSQKVLELRRRCLLKKSCKLNQNLTEGMET
jgi:hypothetical protein